MSENINKIVKDNKKSSQLSTITSIIIVVIASTFLSISTITLLDPVGLYSGGGVTGIAYQG